MTPTTGGNPRAPAQAIACVRPLITATRRLEDAAAAFALAADRRAAMKVRLDFA